MLCFIKYVKIPMENSSIQPLFNSIKTAKNQLILKSGRYTNSFRTILHTVFVHDSSVFSGGEGSRIFIDIHSNMLNFE